MYMIGTESTMESEATTLGKTKIKEGKYMKRFLSLFIVIVMCASLVTPVIGAKSPFTDVKESDWFYGDVENAYSLGLINGKGSTDTYKPGDNMTYAEAIKLAACMYQSYTEGKVTLQNGDPWYQS